ncbi:non-ribosomal peptide synthetase [Winogradskyella sp. PG-2]|uniref:non-ribosomal peptide synthetase n=1 Tax=Winogradskyella sp. PG-2 TaxID=754409 RepID=UPI0004588801|nr:amino acid adenylation domain-containing protein [Winogradskyella sp. PG-2]BAO74621.1 long-chain-fatty-acid--CoA ligase [Winogradskyella sp. PG-2]
MKNEIDKKSLLSQWKKQKDKTTPTTPKITKVPDGEAIPLSRGQERLWFLQQLYPDNSFYNHAESFTILGDLNVEYLSKSFDLIIEQHDVLKSYFPVEEGKTTIKINSDFKLTINQQDFSELSLQDAKQKATNFIEKEIVTPFNLNTPPLIRVSLTKLSNSHHILSINIHHIIIDEWSMKNISNLLSKYYTTLSNNEIIETAKPQIQYQDFAYWEQHRTLPSKQIDYWKTKLSGTIPVLELHTDYRRPLQPTFNGGHYTSNLSKKDSEDLLAFAKIMKTTPFVIALSLFKTLLYRYTKQKDILIGLPITNRDHKSLQNLIGFFVDTVVLRTKFEGHSTFTQLVSKVRKNTLEAFSNKAIPFDYLVKELLPNRSLAMNPFFQVMFVYNNEERDSNFGPDIEFKKEEDILLKSSKFDLTLFVNEKDGLLSTTFEFATDLFDTSTIKRFSEHYNLLVQAVISNSDVSISELPMLTKQENDLFTSTKAVKNNSFSTSTGIHHIIEDIVKKHPYNTAVSFGSKSLTYEDLNNKAIALAHVILANKNEEDTIIGLSIERSTAMIVGLLAILKAGCAYLPIDPDYPAERIDFILKDAKVNCIITQDKLIPIFNNFNADLISIDNLKNVNSHKLPTVSNSNLAYVIYTSGSTGNPKGVPITHKNIINSTAGRLDFYDSNPTAFLLMSSISFDSSKAGIFWTLCTGGNLVISEIRLEQDIEQIETVIEEQKISHTLMLPSLYHLIIEHSDIQKLKTLTTVIVAGEVCSVSLAKKHFSFLPRVDLYNEYGPTEATVWCIAHKISEEDVIHGTIPIGNSVTHADIQLLDSELRPVPFGAIGELFIGGQSLSGYYINRPDLTKATYIKNNNGKLFYKTGDIAKYNYKGTIEFLGRIDQQVKIRGYRVELDEIEHTLNTNKMIKKAVVVIETTDKNINLDPNEIIETSNLAELLNMHLKEQDIDKLIGSIKALDTNEKEYLLNQIK